MLLEIKHQESYSRGELLLRTIFGYFYIVLPHVFVLAFVGLAAGVLQFLAFWVILFTGRYPESWFEFQVKYMRWGLRLTARMYNMADGYPKFGLNAADDHVKFEVPYPQKVSRGLTLVRLLFGWLYVGIPHGIILMLLSIVSIFVLFIAWWAILFTGKYPTSLFDYMMHLIRWNQRVSLYLGYMTDDYPPFSGAPDAPAAPAAPGAPQNPVTPPPAPSSTFGPAGPAPSAPPRFPADPQTSPSNP